MAERVVPFASSVQIGESLLAVSNSLMELGRINNVLLLLQDNIGSQLPLAEEAARRIEQAERLEVLVHKRYGLRPRPVRWRDPARISKLIEDRSLSALVELRGETEQRTASGVHHALALATTGLSNPSIVALEELATTLPRSPAQAPTPSDSKAEGGVSQVLRGPPHFALDPLFKPTFSLLEYPTRQFQDPDLALSCLGLAMREAMASGLGSLNVVEHDGLPSEFYVDFSRQAWDEIRHAKFFLDSGLALLPEFVADCPNHPGASIAEAHLRNGTGVPVPLEGNLYEAVWNATLEERLILMNMDTEGPTVSEFRALLDMDVCIKRPWFAQGIDGVSNDEANHARIGRRWMRALLPTQEQRESAMARARTLRGVLVLTAVAHNSNSDLMGLVERYLAESDRLPS